MERRGKDTLLMLAFALSLAGLIDSFYLSYKHLTLNPLYCSNFGCDVVTTSAYSVILGIPVAYLGILYYGTLAMLIVAYLFRKRSGLLWVSRVTVSIGVLFSGWFVYVQAFILGEICPYCVVSAAITLVLSIVLWSKWSMIKNNNI